ncbi:MAG: Sec-independent protein translocase protein TatB [Acidiferrobacterales bacterium]|nr:Sec-independent protein translocase protein TatB [Acidiferrobacterales bacterium]
MFDIGFWELLVIAVVLLLVLGPERLPEVAKQAAFFVRKARQGMFRIRNEMRSELGDDPFQGLQDARREVNNLKNDVRQFGRDLADSHVESTKPVESTKAVKPTKITEPEDAIGPEGEILPAISNAAATTVLSEESDEAIKKTKKKAKKKATKKKATKKKTTSNKKTKKKTKKKTASKETDEKQP